MISFRASGAESLLMFPSRRVVTAEVVELRRIHLGVIDESIVWETTLISWTRIYVAHSLPNTSPAAGDRNTYSSTVIPEMEGRHQTIVQVDGPSGCLNNLVTLEPNWQSGYQMSPGGEHRFAWRLRFNVNATALIERWCVLGKPNTWRTDGSADFIYSQPFPLRSEGFHASEIGYLSEPGEFDFKEEKPAPVIMNQRQLREG